MHTDILLESGTNELEVMEFSIDGIPFGINVAKVTEIMKTMPTRPIPNSHASVEGVFKPRDKIITVFNLPYYLGLNPSEDDSRDLFMITGFNKLNVAFHVHTVEGIHRIKWSDIEKPDTTAFGGRDGLATGVAKINKKLISIIDFEKIIADINPETGIQLSEIEMLGERERSEKPILTADDSTFLRDMIHGALVSAGYTNIRSFSDGKELWDCITKIRDETRENGIPLETEVATVISDIEMPVMDGHRLLKLIKDDKHLKNVPVILFSSLIDDAMRHKGSELGANAQLSKPEIGNLVTTIDKLVGRKVNR
ncbi:MAG: chemotaxis protein [Oscillospiraceae bacterium]|nr:chemotaxis protein [Oscillospiraceae bacterium]